LLECHYERNDWESFQQVLQKLPADAPDEPRLLLLMKGEFALHQENWKAAVVQFEKLLAEEPAHVTACLGLSRAYGQLGRREQSRHFQERTRVLSRIRPQLVDVTESNPSACEKLAEQCDSIGYQEAAATFRRHAERIQRHAKHTRHHPPQRQLEPRGERPR
jgi:lipopolysaccharide biosynthesis regulator YciM